MVKEIQPDRSSGARTRGAIQKGETGDKVAGFDPAVAPYETDAEVGGNPTLTEAQSPKLEKSVQSVNATTHASGMRAWDHGHANMRKKANREDLLQ
jgi:hypothetical protein